VHEDMEGPGAASRRGRSQAHLANLRSRPKRARVRGHSRACARAASPCPARCGQLVASGAARSEAATHPPTPAQETAARWPAHQLLPRTATAAPKSMNGSGAPSVVVRQSCGSKASIQASFKGRRVSTSPVHHRKETKGRREQSGRAVLTVGRRCSRGRLGEGVCTGGVDVHTGGCPPQL
jgi:hypothetical protein